MTKVKIWVAGVYITERGMGSGHIPYLHDVITKLLADEYKTDVSKVWSVVADDLESLAEYIRKEIVEDGKNESGDNKR